jgi:hypothetical protein
MSAMRAHVSVAILAALAGASPALAQTSASYKLTESTLNNGGNPSQGSVLSSASFHVKLDAIGDAVAQASLSSASFHADAGFVGAHPPPGEVMGLAFTDKQTLTWNPERSAGSYNVYRDALSTLPGGFGFCFAPRLAATTATDAASPSIGTGYFYLVTARSRLDEEGTKGAASSGAQRANSSPCP